MHVEEPWLETGCGDQSSSGMEELWRMLAIERVWVENEEEEVVFLSGLMEKV